MPKSRIVVGVCILVTPLALLGTSWISVAQEQDQPQPTPSQPEHQAMQCPMMGAMKNVEVHADSPVLLLAQAEKLKLTDGQKQEIRKLAEQTRQQARQLLTAEQQEQLAEAPEGRLSIKQVAALLGVEQMKGQAGQMCPMCMRMMRQQMQQQNAQRTGEHEQHHVEQNAQ